MRASIFITGVNLQQILFCFQRTIWIVRIIQYSTFVRVRFVPYMKSYSGKIIRVFAKCMNI